MVVSNEQLLERPLLELRTCPSCLRFASFSHTDIRKNQIVRIYECQCGRQFSDPEKANIISKSSLNRSVGASGVFRHTRKRERAGKRATRGA